MHVGSKTFWRASREFSKLKCNLHFLPHESKYWLDKDFAFVRVFGTIRYAEQKDKALRCFTILTLTLFLKCIFQIPPASTER